jgi:hypothetical protein
MNNAAFLALGPMGFFDLYPVTDLSPVVDVIPPGRFARIAAKVMRRAAAPTIANRLTVPFKPQAHGGPATDADLRIVDKDHRVQYFDVCPPIGQGLLHTLATADCPTQSSAPVCLKLRSTAAHTSIPVFYLPYALNQHRRMTLADKQGVGGVDVFLTDVVDGCSVYVEGTTQNPTVSHLNANAEHSPGLTALPSKANPAALKGDWKHKADHMHNRYQGAPQPKRVTLGVGVQPARRVDYKHYGLRLQADETALEGSLVALQAANRAPATVGGVAVTSIQVIHAAGTIFGHLVLGNWTFYVQRRVLVSLHALHGGPILARQWLIQDVQPFWPAGTGKLA